MLSTSEFQSLCRKHDLAATHYDSKWGISYGEVGRAQVLGKLHKALAGDERFGRGLEVGAGTGYFTLNLLQAGVLERAVATDISPGMLATLSASADPGSTFAGWTGDIASDASALSFTMRSNLVLQANFIPNPFAPVAGIYQGLFYDTNEVAHQSSGFFNGKLTSAGKLSAKLVIAGLKASLSGQFSAVW